MRRLHYAVVMVTLIVTCSISDTFAQEDRLNVSLRGDRGTQKLDLRAVPATNASTAKTDAAMLAMRRKLGDFGIEKPPLPRTTWEQLNSHARQDLLTAYAQALSSKSASSQEINKALIKASHDANRNAFDNLTKKKLIDPRIVWEAQPHASLEAYRHALVRFGDQPVDSPKREDETPPPRKRVPRVGCGNNCAVVSPGIPEPQAPNTALPLVASRSTGKPGSGVGVGLAGRRQRPFNPAGFLEVAIIDLPDGGTCTGTLLSPSIVLTAAHCVVGYATTSLKVRLPTFRLSVLDQCKHTLDAETRYEQCLDFDLLTVRAAVPHAQYSAGDKRNDVAYLILSMPRQGATIALIEFRDAPPDRITLAGYGDNGLSGSRNLEMQNAIEVGWHVGAALTQGIGKIGWLYSPSGNDSASCHGDSGGPIYEGDYDGGLHDGPHKIFAITSTGSASSCKNFYVQNTNLGSPTIRNWLCKEAELRAVIGACLPGATASLPPRTPAA